MADYTLKILSVCAGGEHISLRILKDLAAVKDIVVTKSDLMDSDVDLSDAIVFLARQAIKNSGATTNVQRKTAIEGMVITL